MLKFVQTTVYTNVNFKFDSLYRNPVLFYTSVHEPIS